MNLKNLSIFFTALLLAGCSTNSSTKTSEITMVGTIIENPSRLADQPNFLLINSETNTLLAYISSETVALQNFIEETGTLVGNRQLESIDHIPKVLVTNFTAPQANSLEDILLRTTKREVKKAPFNYNWDKNASMLVLQSDNQNGSAQIQVNAGSKSYVVKLVKTQDSWHIADIETTGYSASDSTPISATGSVSTH